MLAFKEEALEYGHMCSGDNYLWKRSRVDARGHKFSSRQQDSADLSPSTCCFQNLEQDPCQVITYYITNIPEAHSGLQATPNFRISTAVSKATPVIDLSAI